MRCESDVDGLERWYRLGTCCLAFLFVCLGFCLIQAVFDHGHAALAAPAPQATVTPFSPVGWNPITFTPDSSGWVGPEQLVSCGSLTVTGLCDADCFGPGEELSFRTVGPDEVVLVAMPVISSDLVVTAVEGFGFGDWVLNFGKSSEGCNTDLWWGYQNVTWGFIELRSGDIFAELLRTQSGFTIPVGCTQYQVFGSGWANENLNEPTCTCTGDCEHDHCCDEEAEGRYSGFRQIGCVMWNQDHGRTCTLYGGGPWWQDVYWDVRSGVNGVGECGKACKRTIGAADIYDVLCVAGDLAGTWLLTHTGSYTPTTWYTETGEMVEGYCEIDQVVDVAWNDGVRVHYDPLDYSDFSPYGIYAWDSVSVSWYIVPSEPSWLTLSETRRSLNFQYALTTTGDVTGSPGAGVYEEWWLGFQVYRNGVWTDTNTGPEWGIDIDVTPGECYVLVPEISNPVSVSDTLVSGVEVCLMLVEPNINLPILGNPLPFLLPILGIGVAFLLHRLVRD